MKLGKIRNRLMAGISTVIGTIMLTVTRVQADLIKDANNFETKGGKGALEMSVVWANLKPVASVLFTAAVAVIIGVGMVIGVKFMIKGPDEKAKMKEKLIWYVIAMVLVFGVVGIFKILASTLGTITDN